MRVYAHVRRAYMASGLNPPASTSKLRAFVVFRHVLLDLVTSAVVSVPFHMPGTSLHPPRCVRPVSKAIYRICVAFYNYSI